MAGWFWYVLSEILNTDFLATRPNYKNETEKHYNIFVHISEVAVVSFCNRTKSVGSRINMVLLRNYIPEQEILECECGVEVKSESHGYVWNVQDVILNPSSHLCYSDHSTSEETPFCINDTNMDNIKAVGKFPLSNGVFTLRFRKEALPEMVWIQVKGK